MTKKLTKTHPKYDEIIEKCKDLYLTPSAKGNYMAREKIARKLCEVFDITMTKKMVEFWASKFDWDKLREKSKMMEVAKSRSELMTQEENLINTVHQQIAEMYKQSDQLSKIAASIIAEAYKTGNLTPTNAIRLLKDCTDTKMRLLGIEDHLKVNVVDTRLEELKKMNPEEREALKKRYIEQLKKHEG